MRRFTNVIVLIAALVISTAAMAQVRGKGRLQGMVVDKSTGKPVAEAKVTVAPASGNTAPIVTKTNAKGRFSALGLVSGQWHIDIEAPGYVMSRGSANVSELQMMNVPTIELVPEVKQEAPPAEIAGPSVPKEAVDAINLGQELLKQEKYKEAIVEFEKALPLIPADEQFRTVTLQINQVLSQAYYKTGDLKKAISLLETVSAADTSNTGVALLLTNLYLEDGQLDKGRATLAALPAWSVTDPTIYLNIGILFLNKNNPSDGASYFAKAIELDAARAESYYYRGLANLQLKKSGEAKADFQKVIELAPDSPEARDAKQLIEGLK